METDVLKYNMNVMDVIQNNVMKYNISTIPFTNEVFVSRAKPETDSNKLFS